MQTFGWLPELDVSLPGTLRLIDPASLSMTDHLAWDRLSREAEPGGFFQERWFLGPLLRGRRDARVAVIEAQCGTWLGLIAVERASSLGRLPMPLWQSIKDANQFIVGPLVRKGASRSFWASLIDGLGARGDGTIGLYLRALPRDGAVSEALRALCHDQRRSCELIASHDRAVLTGDGDFERWWQSRLPAKKRLRHNSLVRQTQCQLGPISLMEAHGDQAVAQWIEAFLALEAAGWKGAAGSAMAAKADTQRLFSEVVTGAASAGMAQCLTLSAGDHVLAHSVQFICGDHGCGFKTCYDEQHARLAPGMQMLVHISRTIVDRRGLHFDSCSTPDQATIHNLWNDRRTIDDIAIALPGAARARLFDAAMGARRLWHSGKGLLAKADVTAPAMPRLNTGSTRQS